LRAVCHLLRTLRYREEKKNKDSEWLLLPFGKRDCAPEPLRGALRRLSNKKALRLPEALFAKA
jgi:hypothetical protein